MTSLSKNQRQDFAKIMDLSLSTPSPNDMIPMFSSSHPTKILKTRIPETYAELQNKYIEGIHSFHYNLPYPKVHKVNKHTYVTVRQCIADFLSHGYCPQHIPHTSPFTISSISQSKRAQQILYNANNVHSQNSSFDVVPMMGFTWSDGFQPQSMKVASGSSWVKTISFISNNNSEGSLYNTYLLSLGKSTDNHQEIEDVFMKELYDLKHGINNIFYSSYHKKRVHIHFEIVAVLADQPERRSMCCWKMGNGRNTSRWKYAFDVKQIHQYLPLCSDCLNSLIEEPTDFDFSTNCEHCLKWNFNSSSSMLNTIPHVNYPVTQSQSQCLMRPLKISFPQLANAAKKAHMNIVSEEWTSKMAIAFLDSVGINEYAITKIIDNAERAFSYSFLEKSSVNPSGFQSLVELKEQEPSLFEEWKGCAIWRSPIDIDHVVDVIMHLLFLGVVKEQRNAIRQWMSATRRIRTFNIFQKNINILNSIEKMNLSWCKVVSTESGTSTGWISENYLGFCRIIKWYYHSVLYYKQEQPYTDPQSPVETWLKDQCISFLRVRGLDCSGTRDDLRQKIKDLNSQEGGPPPIIVSNGCSVVYLHRCLTSLLSMVSVAMSKEVNKHTVVALDHKVKAYLSFFHVFQESLQDNLSTHRRSTQKQNNNGQQQSINTNHAPSWLQHFNFLSLLNLPDTMDLYGPLVNMWEGGNRGEGFLRHLKPTITNTVQVNWNFIAHENIMKNKSKAQVLHQHFKNLALNKKVEFERILSQYDTISNYFCYQEINIFWNELWVNKPLSMVLLEKGTICAVLKHNNDDIIGFEVKIKFREKIDTLTMSFFSLETNEDVSKENTIVFSPTDISNYLLMLPKLDEDGFIKEPNQNRYYIITDSWTEMICDDVLIIPQLC